MDDGGFSGLSSLAELNYMRLEALDLFDQCLTEGNPTRIRTFIEQQIAVNPPRIGLLREVAEDLHQRLMGLHENYLELWQRTLEALKHDFSLDFSRDFATKPFYKFEVDTIIVKLNAETVGLDKSDEAVLRKMLDAAVETALQLRADIAMTERLYVYISDWIDGLNATVARRYWADGRTDENPANIH
jgi:hypothetical protein